MSHKSKRYLTNPKSRLLYQSWGSSTLIPPLQWFSCPHASCPVTYTTTNLGDEATLAALHAYCQWEKEELFTVQEIACLNSQRAFQCIKLMEWKEALKTADAYDRVAEEMKDHIPWGAREQTAIGQVIHHLRKHTYTQWEEDAKGIKTSWEVKDHPQKQKKCTQCCKMGHFLHNCPLRAAYQQRL